MGHSGSAVIVQLGGLSLREARRHATQFIERTNSAQSNDDPMPRKYPVSKKTAAIERTRRRISVKHTRSMRKSILAALDALNAPILAELGRIKESVADDIAAAALDQAQGADSTELLALIKKLQALADQMSPDQLYAAIMQIQQQVYEEAAASTQAEVGVSFDLVPARAIATLNSTTIPFAKNVVRREQTAIKAALMDGMRDGDGVKQIAARIRATVSDGVHIVDKGGKVVRVIPEDAWAEQVARTEVTRAMSNAVIDGYRRAKVARVQWLAAEDERTCSECSDADGEIVKLDDGFPSVDVNAPPAHPSCRCNIVMADDDEEDDDADSSGD